MDAIEEGLSVKGNYNSDSGDDEDDEDLNQDLDILNFKNGVANARSIHSLCRNNINTGPKFSNSKAEVNT